MRALAAGCRRELGEAEGASDGECEAGGLFLCAMVLGGDAGFCGRGGAPSLLRT